MTTGVDTPPLKTFKREVLSSVTIRFAGDSGDGVQITGGQFTNTTAIAGNDLATLPDFPAEIRAPAGTLPGVSGFQIQFSSNDIHTPGDQPDVLVVFNPAALKVHLPDLAPNGIIIADTSQFDKAHLVKAGYTNNPLEDGSLAKFRVIKENLVEKTLLALKSFETLSSKEKTRCKNFYALGVAYWLFNRPLDPTLRWIKDKFKKEQTIADANVTALKGGFAYCEMTDVFQAVAYEIPPAPSSPGTYRNLSGNQALSMGLVAAKVLAGKQMFFGAYPITPASDILHDLSKHKNFGIITFQAEDEIAAIASAIGAAYAGNIAVTATAGPGSSLKMEAAGLAFMTELPLLIIDVQRGGPSTGLPTKTEQSDLLQTMYGRHGESPVCIIAPATPGECFNYVIEAVRIALQHMMPVYFLSDGYLANGAEPWKIPPLESLKKIEVSYQTNPENFQAYRRDPKTLARNWAIPGTPGLEHRIGGLEKKEGSGAVSYDAHNHEKMTVIRQQKVERVADDIPLLEVEGPADADILVIGWGSTYGSIRAGIEKAADKGHKVAQAHLRYLNPFPKNTQEVLKKYKKVLCPEMNMGQLSFLLRGKFLIDVIPLNKMQGSPFKAKEILAGIEAVIKGKPVPQPAEHGPGSNGSEQAEG